MSMKRLKSALKFALHGEKSLPGLALDNLRVTKKNTAFLEDSRFKAAVKFAVQANEGAWNRKGQTPDIRWRLHICCWAARHGLALEGDFVEFGVYAGLTSLTVCELLDFNSIDRRFWLFDTFSGLPTEGLTAREASKAEDINDRLYYDVFEMTKKSFSKFSNAILVRGNLPGSLEGVPIEKISYLHVDLNFAKYEKASIEAVWDRVVPGAFVVLDDYAFAGHEEQYEMWNEFAASKGLMVLTLPTGQGLIIKG